MNFIAYFKKESFPIAARSLYAHYDAISIIIIAFHYEFNVNLLLAFMFIFAWFLNVVAFVMALDMIYRNIMIYGCAHTKFHE